MLRRRDGLGMPFLTGHTNEMLLNIGLGPCPGSLNPLGAGQGDKCTASGPETDFRIVRLRGGPQRNVPVSRTELNFDIKPVTG